MYGLFSLFLHRGAKFISESCPNSFFFLNVEMIFTATGLNLRSKRWTCKSNYEWYWEFLALGSITTSKNCIISLPLKVRNDSSAIMMSSCRDFSQYGLHNISVCLFICTCAVDLLPLTNSSPWIETEMHSVSYSLTLILLRTSLKSRQMRCARECVWDCCVSWVPPSVQSSPSLCGLKALRNCRPILRKDQWVRTGYRCVCLNVWIVKFNLKGLNWRPGKQIKRLPGFR